MLLIQENFPAVIHPETKEEVENVKRKIQQLIDELQKSRTKILIPTPVLAETFTRFGGKTDEVFQILHKDYGFQFGPFDIRAAIEAGMAFYSARQQGDKKSGSSRSWQKVKFDRQIVSIAKVNNATAVYSNDKQVRRWAEELGMRGIAVWDLESPPPSQAGFEFDDSADENEPESETEGVIDVE